MDEDAYKKTYAVVNPVLCCFEKTILARKFNCRFSHRFNLADREGIACHSKSAQSRCNEVLRQVRNKSRFALQLGNQGEALPHNTEICIQLGTLTTLQDLVDAEPPDDIDGLLAKASADVGGIESYPFEKIIRMIAHNKPRPRRRSRKDR